MDIRFSIFGLLLVLLPCQALVFQGSCADPSVSCEQLCVTLSPDTYECGCWNDHFLIDDGVGCKVNSSSFRVFHRSEVDLTPLISESSPLPRPLSFHGSNYAEFPLVDSAYLQTNITIEFKITDARDGILLFAGQIKGDDYISIALIGPNIVLRHDCGEGAIEDLYRGPFTTAEWHNLTVWRRYCDRTEMRADKKTRMVDLTEQFKYYKGITMEDGIFIGGAPRNIEFLDTKAGTDRGLNGCVRKLAINGELLLDTSTDINKAVNKKSLEYCGAAPRLDDFVEFNIATGTEPPRELIRKEKVLAEVRREHQLKEQATTAKKAELDISTMSPTPSPVVLRTAEFSGSGEQCQTAPSSIAEYLETTLHVKPSTSTGILFHWQAGSKYMAVYLRKGFVTLEMNMGGDTALLRSEETIRLHQWHKIEIWRSGRGVLLKVNRQTWVDTELSSLGNDVPSAGTVCVGGSTASLPYHLANMNGYHGCVKHVRVNSISLPLHRSADVRECGADPCSFAGCPHTCASKHLEFVCLCEWPTYGTKCEKSSRRQVTAMRFSGHSHLKLSDQKYMNMITGESLRLTIEFKLSNDSMNEEQKSQLLAFSGDDGQRSDFFRLQISSEGRPQFIMNLGSGNMELSHPSQVEPGRWHMVSVIRDKRHVTLSLDGHSPISTMAPEGSEQMNVYSALLIGGVPSESLSGDGLVGCIESIDIGSITIQHPSQAQAAINIEDCSE